MRRALLVSAVAIGLGIGAAEFLTHSFVFRRWLGQVARRGELQALVRQKGIYDTDMTRAWEAELFLQGADPQEIAASTAQTQKEAALQRLIIRARIAAAASGETIRPAALAREMNLLRRQFPDEKAWTASLGRAGATPRLLEDEVRANLRERDWIETQIAGQLPPNESDLRQFYAEHRAAFQEPLRLRASHLFLAAPDGYPAEVIEAKRALINLLAKRLANGESFPALVAEYSEDEASKNRDGDLGYFAAERMLPGVFAAAEGLHPGETSAPVRSRLGFHLIHLTESLPARELTFEEARPEIIAELENRHRTAAVNALLIQLGQIRQPLHATLRQGVFKKLAASLFGVRRPWATKMPGMAWRATLRRCRVWFWAVRWQPCNTATTERCPPA